MKWITWIPFSGFKSGFVMETASGTLVDGHWVLVTTSSHQAPAGTTEQWALVDSIRHHWATTDTMDHQAASGTIRHRAPWAPDTILGTGHQASMGTGIPVGHQTLGTIGQHRAPSSRYHWAAGTTRHHGAPNW